MKTLFAILGCLTMVACAAKDNNTITTVAGDCTQVVYTNGGHVVCPNFDAVEFGGTVKSVVALEPAGGNGSGTVLTRLSDQTLVVFNGTQVEQVQPGNYTAANGNPYQVGPAPSYIVTF